MFKVEDVMKWKLKWMWCHQKQLKKKDGGWWWLRWWWQWDEDDVAASSVAKGKRKGAEKLKKRSRAIEAGKAK